MQPCRWLECADSRRDPANLHSELGLRGGTVLRWSDTVQSLPHIRHTDDDDHPLARGVHSRHHQSVPGHPQFVPLHTSYPQRA